MPKTNERPSTIELTTLSPIYANPLDDSHNSIFYTNEERAAKTLYLQPVQSCIFRAATMVCSQKKLNIEARFLVADATDLILKHIIRCKGLYLSIEMCQKRKPLKGYFTQFAKWRIQDMLKCGRYWRELIGSGRIRTGFDDKFLNNISIEEPQTDDYFSSLTLANHYTCTTLLKSQTPITPSAKLKYLMLYAPELVERKHFIEGAIIRGQSKGYPAHPTSAWSTWQTHLNYYTGLRESDHRDLTRSRRFCTWILNRPFLKNETAFAKLDPATEKNYRENMLNRAIHRIHKRLMLLSIIRLLTNETLEQIDTLLPLLVQALNPKESSTHIQFRNRCIRSRLSKWYSRYQKNRYCYGSITEMVSLIHVPNKSFDKVLEEGPEQALRWAENIQNCARLYR